MASRNETKHVHTTSKDLRALKTRPVEARVEVVEPKSGVVAAEAAPDIFEMRPDLADEVRSLVDASKAHATRLAYRFDWKVFSDWCSANGQKSMPADAKTVSCFLAEQARTKATSTVLRYAASISKLHTLQKHESPVRSEEVRTLLSGLKRTKGEQATNAKDALTATMVKEDTSQVDAPSIADIRDRAVLLVAIGSGARRSELSRLRIEDLKWSDQGIIATIRKSKTDQTGKGRDVALPRVDDTPHMCPVRAVRAWLDVLKEDTGFLFRGLTKKGEPKRNGRPMCAAVVGTIEKQAAAALGLDPSAFGAHASRAGYVTAARQAGVSWEAIMRQTGHKKLETVKRYDRGTVDLFKETQVAAIFKHALKKAE